MSSEETSLETPTSTLPMPPWMIPTVPAYVSFKEYSIDQESGNLWFSLFTLRRNHEVCVHVL